MFQSLETRVTCHENVTFGDSGKGKVMGVGKIAISKDRSLSDVMLVESLDYNLLSITQLCQLGYNCLFTDRKSVV